MRGQGGDKLLSGHLPPAGCHQSGLLVLLLASSQAFIFSLVNQNSHSYIYTCQALCIRDAAADNDVWACLRREGSRAHAQMACDL